MTPPACKAPSVMECLTGEDYYGGCCSTSDHAECAICKKAPDATTSERDHADLCGWKSCTYESNIRKQADCCREVQNIFGFSFATGTSCEQA